jgi:hypothetical protein
MSVIRRATGRNAGALPTDFTACPAEAQCLVSDASDVEASIFRQ